MLSDIFTLRILSDVSRWHHHKLGYHYTCSIERYDPKAKFIRAFGVEKKEDGIWVYTYNREPVSKYISWRLNRTRLSTDYADRW